MARLPLNLGIPRFKESEEKVHILANGSENADYVADDGSRVPSIRKFMRAQQDEVNAIQSGIQSDRSLAQSARVGAESARDQAGAYAGNTAVNYQWFETIALGRAAVPVDQSFGVIAGGSDGLTRPTVYRKRSSTGQDRLFTQLAVNEFDAEVTARKGSENFGDSIRLSTGDGSTGDLFIGEIPSSQSELTMITGRTLRLQWVAPNTVTDPKIRINGEDWSIYTIRGGEIPVGGLRATARYVLIVARDEPKQLRLTSALTLGDLEETDTRKIMTQTERTRLSTLWDSVLTNNAKLIEWVTTGNYSISGATYDASGVVQAGATVTWPDGGTGAIVSVAPSAAFPGLIDGFRFSHTTFGRYVHQSNVTRNAMGQIITQPALTTGTHSA